MQKKKQQNMHIMNENYRRNKALHVLDAKSKNKPQLFFFLLGLGITVSAALLLTYVVVIVKMIKGQLMNID